jgi:tetratricopeptide (TPR) repeat protein
MRRSRLLLVASAFALSLAPGRAFAAPGNTPGVPSSNPSAGPAPSQAPAKKPRVEPGLSVEASLARATAFYEAGQYDQCADAFAALLGDAGPTSSLAPRAREQASVYRAACLIALGRVDEADEAFRDAIRENPQMAVPNAIMFPPAVIERFIVVRTTLMEEIRRSEQDRALRARDAALAARRKAEQEKERIARLEELASQETLIVRNRRWVAWVPFGVGQFQNRDYGAGAAFLASELLLAGTAIGAVSIQLSLHSQAQGGANISGDIEQLNQNIKSAWVVSLAATGGFVLVAGLGILHANLEFVPEFNEGTRPRSKPKPAASRAGIVSAGVAPTEGGAALSILGRF